MRKKRKKVIKSGDRKEKQRKKKRRKKCKWKVNKQVEMREEINKERKEKKNWFVCSVFVLFWFTSYIIDLIEIVFFDVCRLSNKTCYHFRENWIFI